MKKIISALLIAILAVTLAACGKTDVKETASQTLQDFKIGYLASTGHILYFIAKEKGYFEEEGLNAELVLFNNSGEGITAVSTGKLDAGSFGTPAPLIYISKGNPITIIGGQMSQGHALVTKPERVQEFSDLKNFKGKTIATIRLATGDIVFRQGLIDLGLSPKEDVKFTEMESAAAAIEAVKNGMADAAVVWTPFRKTAEAQGLSIVKYSPEIPGFENHPCCRQIANSTAVKEHPDKYEAFLRALIKAYRYYKTDQDGSIEILSKYVNIDKKVLKEETYGKYVESNPDPNKPAVKDFYRYMKSVGYIDKDVDLDRNIDTSNYKNALAALLAKEPSDPIFLILQADFKE